MPSPFRENFSDCVELQPVTSENTTFERVDGQVMTIAAQARGALFGLGAWITNSHSGGAPWTDAGLFTDESTGQRRLFFRAFVSVTSLTGPNLTFMWLSAPNDDTPIVSIGVDNAKNLVGTGLTLASGSATLGTFLRWSRVDVVVVESGADLLVTADIYSGLNIYSADPAVRSGQLSGTIVGGADLLANGAWLWLGRETSTTPTSATITVDSVMFDAVPQPAGYVMDPEPGFFVLRDTGMERVELLGEWDGAAYDELEFLGRWNGSIPLNPNYDFEEGIDGWSTTTPGASVASTTAWAESGSRSMEIRGTGATSVVVLTPAFPISLPQMVESPWWTYEGWFYPVSGVTRVYFRMFLYDANGTYLDQWAVQSVLNPTPESIRWLRAIRSVIAGVNDTAAQAVLQIRVDGTDPHVYVDDMVFRYGAPGGIEDPAPLVDTLWLETWPTDGLIGAPWSVNGQPLSTSGGRTVALAGGQRGRAVRPGPTGDAHMGALQAQLPQSTTVGAVALDVRLRDPSLPTDESNDSYLRIGISGSSTLGTATFAVKASGVNYAVITDIDYTKFYDLAVRLDGNEAKGYINNVLIGSYPLSPTSLADLGTSARLIIEGPATVGPIRAENF